MCVCVHTHSHVQPFETPWTATCQASLSMGFSRQEYWSRLPIPTPGDLPNPGIEPVSLASPALVDWFYTTAAPEKPEVKGKQVQFLARSLVVKGRREKDQGLEWMGHWVNILVSFLAEQLVGS